MAETLDLATYEQIATLLSQLMTNYNTLADNYFNIFYSDTPADITITLYNADGTLVDYTIPNRAKDFNFIKNGNGNPEGAEVGEVGTLYQDTINGTLYIKETGTGRTGWVQIPANTNIEEGYGSPEGVLVRGKGTLYIDKDSASMYIKTTSNGNTGWSLIAINTTNVANKDLSNLSVTGENHFTNRSLSNLNTYGQSIINNKADVNLSNLSASGNAVLNAKANVDLTNLSLTGENHFASRGLDNLNVGGQSVLNSKANTTLNNCTNGAFANMLSIAQASDKATIIHWGTPDYTRTVSISSGWYATSDCLVVLVATENEVATVTIDGATFTISKGASQSAGSAQFIVGKNSAISWTNVTQAFAVPLAGEV